MEPGLGLQYPFVSLSNSLIISDPDMGFSFNFFRSWYRRKPFGTMAACRIQRLMKRPCPMNRCIRGDSVSFSSFILIIYDIAYNIVNDIAGDLRLSIRCAHSHYLSITMPEMARTYGRQYPPKSEPRLTVLARYTLLFPVRILLS